MVIRQIRYTDYDSDIINFIILIRNVLSGSKCQKTIYPISFVR